MDPDADLDPRIPVRTGYLLLMDPDADADPYQNLVHYFSPLNTIVRKGKDPVLDPDPYLWLMDPDPEHWEQLPVNF